MDGAKRGDEAIDVLGEPLADAVIDLGIERVGIALHRHDPQIVDIQSGRLGLGGDDPTERALRLVDFTRRLGRLLDLGCPWRLGRRLELRLRHIERQ